MKRTIEVTADDIANGERQKACSCPIALALKRTLGTKYVAVSVFKVSVDLVRASLPPEAVNFIRDFDLGEPVAPFAFDLDT